LPNAVVQRHRDGDQVAVIVYQQLLNSVNGGRLAVRGMEKLKTGAFRPLCLSLEI
jgi:hypothetical protein